MTKAEAALVEKLLEKEVPEIRDGRVRIERSAREPGVCSKIAVSAADRAVDPVRACLGTEGARVRAVVQELGGEKVDIVAYDPDPMTFVRNAIGAAGVSRVLVDLVTHTMQLHVRDDVLMQAIGKKGHNVRLAAQLCGWRIDIHRESRVLEMQARAALGAIEGMTPELAALLFHHGFRSALEVARATVDTLVELAGLEAETALRLLAAAARAAIAERNKA